MAGNREKCLTAGMDEYVSKPIDSTAFKRVISRWFVLEDLNDRRPADDRSEAAIDAGKFVVNISEIEEYAETVEERIHFCQLFLSSTGKALKLQKEQATEGKNETWSEIAHQIKGSAGMIGALEIHQLAGEAQEMLVASKRHRTVMAEKLEAAYGRAAEYLENYISEMRQTGGVSE